MKAPPEAIRALIGQGLDAIDTPALVVDLDAMERNTQRMADFARRHQLRWRPHAKMHKCSELANWLVAQGAGGCCVQKTAEAEVMAAGGVLDIYISNEVIGGTKLARLVRLAKSLAARGGRLALAVDSLEGVRRLAASLEREAVQIDVTIEIDVGHGRCGAPPGLDVLPIASAIAEVPGLRLVGLQAYHGRAQHFRSTAERRTAIVRSAQFVQLTLDLLAEQYAQPLLVTGGGTGSLAMEAASGLWGEIQPGSFLFMDADYARNERDPAQPTFEHALFVKTQVMSTASTHAVCDAGHKAHAIDSGMPLVLQPDGAPELVFTNGGDEHGIVRPAMGRSALPAIGHFLWLIPGHCDPTVNLHDHLIGVRGGLAQGRVERIFTVDARGALT